MAIYSLCYLGNDLLASGAFDACIKIWNVKTGNLVITLNGHTKCVSSLAYLGNNLLASCSADNTIKIWKIKNYNWKILCFEFEASILSMSRIYNFFADPGIQKNFL